MNAAGLTKNRQLPNTMMEAAADIGPPPIVSDISVTEWLEAEKSIGFNQPPESVTVKQYAALRRFRPTAAGRQKAYRILESLVEHKKAVRLQTSPACYRLRSTNIEDPRAEYKRLTGEDYESTIQKG